MKPSEQRWPAQQAPDDFAERVVQAGLSASRASFAEIERPVRRASNRFFKHAALGLSLAAAVTVGAIALHWGKVEAEAESRTKLANAQLIEAQTVATRKTREVAELHAKVAELEDRLREREESELAYKLSMSQPRLAKARPASTPSASAPARLPKPPPACNCAPGDALCSCL